MIFGTPKRPMRVQTAYHKLTQQFGGYLSPQERQRLHTIQADTSPTSDVEDNRWLLEMEQTVQDRIARGRSNV